jgi:dihydropyrimidinase
MDYTPYEGKTIKGWPITTLVRGEVVAEAGEFVGAAGKGRFLKCDISPATAPLGRRTIPFDPATGLVEPGKASRSLALKDGG